MDTYRRKFDELYAQYAGAIYRFIYLRISDEGMVEDIVHDTFLQFWKTLAAGIDVKEPRALLYTIARGFLVDYYRKRKHRQAIDIEAIEVMSTLAMDDVEERTETKRDVAAVLEKLRSLKREYQDALLLYYIEDLSVTEIAGMLGKSENSVRVLIHRALKALKSKL